MPTKMKSNRQPLPKSFDGLVKVMPPMAITDDIHLAATLDVIDRLMQIEELSAGQASYLETLSELAEVYEAKHHAIDVSGITGLDGLKHVMSNAGLSGSDLARLLGIHPTMGSKILNGDRKLTWDHAKILASHFKLRPAFFMD